MKLIKIIGSVSTTDSFQCEIYLISLHISYTVVISVMLKGIMCIYYLVIGNFFFIWHLRTDIAF